MKKLIILPAVMILLCGGTIVDPHARSFKKEPTAVSKLESIASAMDSTANSLDNSTRSLKTLSR